MAFDPAWQLFADMVVLSADPRTVPPEQIAGLEVRATFLAGREVYRKRLLTRPQPWHASKHVRPG